MRDSAGSRTNCVMAPPQMLRIRCSVSTLFCVLLLMIRDQRLDLPFDRRGLPLTLFPSDLFDHLFSFSFAIFPPLKILIKIRIFCCLGSEAGVEEPFVCVCAHVGRVFARADRAISRLVGWPGRRARARSTEPKVA